jgi:hypothetical protein
MVLRGQGIGSDSYVKIKLQDFVLNIFVMVEDKIMLSLRKGWFHLEVFKQERISAAGFRWRHSRSEGELKSDTSYWNSRRSTDSLLGTDRTVEGHAQSAHQ